MNLDLEKENNNEFYPSAKLFYFIIKNEYDLERNRMYNLDKKCTYLFFAGIFILLSHFRFNIDILRSINLRDNSTLNLILSITLILVVPALYLWFFSICIDSYFIFKYVGFGYENLNKSEFLEIKEENSYKILIQDYQKILDINRNNNDEKYKKIKFGSLILIIILMIFIIEIIFYSYNILEKL